MITQEQIDINEDVQELKQKFPEQKELLATLIVDQDHNTIDDLNFIVLTIKRHKNLVLSLDILEQKIDFLINCVFLYRITLENYIFDSIDPHIAEEYTKRDMIELFEHYDIIPIHARKAIK